MMNSKEWKDLISEVLGDKIIYADPTAIAVKHGARFVIIEKSQSGLTAQIRKSLDASDVIAETSMVVNGKIVSALTHSNYDDVKKILIEFVSMV
jgi:hypothetical protein